MKRHDRVWDVAVVDGGAAGRSAALTLAPALRNVIVIDSAEPRNVPGLAARRLLGQEGVKPSRLLDVDDDALIELDARTVPSLTRAGQTLSTITATATA